VLVRRTRMVAFDPVSEGFRKAPGTPGTGLGGEGYGFLDFSLIISPSTANLPYP
jgi:hypothetical protein